MNGNMQKAVILLLLLGGALGVFLVSNNNMRTHSVKNVEYNAMVCINGREKYCGALITEDDKKTIVVVPLIKTLSSIGVEVQWEECNTAILRYKGEKYEVDLNHISFMPLDAMSDNLLQPPPGSSYKNRVADGDILIDYGLFSYLANYMGINIVSADIDNASQCLTIIIEN